MNSGDFAKLFLFVTILALPNLRLAHADALHSIQAAHDEMDAAADHRNFVGAVAYISPSFTWYGIGDRGWRGNKQEYLQDLILTYKKDAPDVTYILHTTTRVINVNPGDTQKLWGVVYANTEREESIVAHFSERLRKPYPKGTKVSGRDRPPAYWPTSYSQENWEVWMLTGSGWREISCDSYTLHMMQPID